MLQEHSSSSAHNETPGGRATASATGYRPIAPRSTGLHLARTGAAGSRIHLDLQRAPARTNRCPLQTRMPSAKDSARSSAPTLSQQNERHERSPSLINGGREKGGATPKLMLPWSISVFPRDLLRNEKSIKDMSDKGDGRSQLIEAVQRKPKKKKKTERRAQEWGKGHCPWETTGRANDAHPPGNLGLLFTEVLRYLARLNTQRGPLDLPAFALQDNLASANWKCLIPV